MRTSLLLVLVLAAPAFAGDVWKWVDDKGITHYSDQPVPGATKVELSVGNRWDSATPQRSATDTPATSPAATNEPPYRELEIWKPAQAEVVVNTGGKVPVEIRLNPALQPRHTLSLYLDGKLLEGYPPNSTSYDLSDVPRGSHSLIALITDTRGQRVQESTPLTFTVRQESIASPPVGPTLRPPPKPQPRGASNKLPTSQPTYNGLQGREPLVIDPLTNAPAAKQKDPPKRPGK